jgi:haloalkane dehalogenase
MAIPEEGPITPEVVRTSESRFENLPGYPFAAHYVDVAWPQIDGALRMHYVDEGPADGAVILMVHGEPSWSYLYRKMIPVFVQAGFRAIAIDHLGFGKSDKLTFAPHYSFANHIDSLRQLVVSLDLQDITLVCQDWGGPIGMGVLAKEPDRFARVVAGNTMLHTAEPELAGRLDWAVHGSSEDNSEVSSMLLDWMHHSHRATNFNASDSLQFSTARGVAEAEAAAWDAPFPSEWHKAGMRQFPVLIPVTQSDEGAQINMQT